MIQTAEMYVAWHESNVGLRCKKIRLNLESDLVDQCDQVRRIFHRHVKQFSVLFMFVIGERSGLQVMINRVHRVDPLHKCADLINWMLKTATR